jgi:hypothetical protein
MARTVAAQITLIAIPLLSWSTVTDATPTLVAVGWNGAFVHIDAETGSTTTIRTDMPLQLNALAMSPSRMLVAGTGGGELYAIDPLTGDSQLLLDIDRRIYGMAFSQLGEFFLVTRPTTPGLLSLDVVDLASGQLSVIGALSAGAGAAGLDFSPDGTLLAISPGGSFGNGHQIWSIDTSDARDVALHHVDDTHVNQSLVFNGDGELYALGQGYFGRLDPVTYDPLGPSIRLPPITPPLDLRGIEVIPEPHAALLLLSCLLLILNKRAVLYLNGSCR